MNPNSFRIDSYLAGHAQLAKILDLDAFQRGIDLIRAKSEAGKRIITCGNGGSAYTASHYITDWNKMVNLSTGKPFRGMSLCDNIGLVTAFGNDLSYDDVFSGQVNAIIEQGDLLVAISGSGNSPNVINAVGAAHAAGANSLAIVGYDGGELIKVAQQAVLVPSFDMQLCEDVHLMFGHMVMKTLCGLGMKKLSV